MTKQEKEKVFSEMLDSLKEENDFVGLLTKKFYYDYGIYNHNIEDRYVSELLNYYNIFDIDDKLYINLIDWSYEEYKIFTKHKFYKISCVIDDDIEIYDNNTIEYDRLTNIHIINEEHVSIKQIIQDNCTWEGKTSLDYPKQYYLRLVLVYTDKKEYSKALLTTKNCESLITWSKNDGESKI